MKKKVINQHTEPIVLMLLRPKGRLKYPQRAAINLVEEVTIDESEISPEIEKLDKRKKIRIEDIDIEPEMKDPDKVQVDVEIGESKPKKKRKKPGVRKKPETEKGALIEASKSPDPVDVESPNEESTNEALDNGVSAMED